MKILKFLILQNSIQKQIQLLKHFLQRNFSSSTDAVPTSALRLRLQGERRVRERLRPPGVERRPGNPGLLLRAPSRRPQADSPVRGRRSRLQAQRYLRAGRRTGHALREPQTRTRTGALLLENALFSNE